MSNRFLGGIVGIAFFSIGFSGKSMGQDFLSQPVDDTANAPAAPFLKESDPIAYTANFTHSQAWPAANTPEQKDQLEILKKTSPRIKTLSVDKMGELRHDVRLWNEDSSLQTEVWYSQTAAFKEGTDAQGNPNGIHSELTFKDRPEAFPELNWVGKNTFVGTIQVEPKRTIDVYQFTAEGPVAGFEPFLFNNEKVTAFIDDATRLPLALKTTRYVAVYSYRNAPASLNPPAEYLAAFKKYKDKKAHPYKVP